MTAQLPFHSREEAGAQLGERLRTSMAAGSDSLVLGLVRGGAVIAKYLAQSAGLPWDILIVRKIGAPHQPEYAVGAFAEPDTSLFNTEALQALRLDENWQTQAAARAARQCLILQQELRGSATLPVIAGRHIVLCDDGIATGFSMFAAIAAVRQAGAVEITIAVPVLAPDAKARFSQMDLRLVYLACPAGFHAVGQYYLDFRPVSSDEVRRLLDARQQTQA